MAEVVGCQPLTIVHVSFMVDKVALGQFLSDLMSVAFHKFYGTQRFITVFARACH